MTELCVCCSSESLNMLHLCGCVSELCVLVQVRDEMHRTWVDVCMSCCVCAQVFSGERAVPVWMRTCLCRAPGSAKALLQCIHT